MAEAHPTKEHLAGYVSGSLSDGMNLLIASHLTYCPTCRAEVERFELLGGTLMMDAERPQGLTPPSFDACIAALSEPDSAPAVAPDPASVLPMPIRREVRDQVDALNWKFRMPGLHEYEFEGFDGERVSLLRAKPGVGVLHHTHEGEEATLILTGEMEDQGTVYRCGDVALADHNDDHKPRVVGDELCYCLIVMTGNMKFTGPVGRALNLFTR